MVRLSGVSCRAPVRLGPGRVPGLGGVGAFGWLAFPFGSPPFHQWPASLSSAQARAQRTCRPVPPPRPSPFQSLPAPCQPRSWVGQGTSTVHAGPSSASGKTRYGALATIGQEWGLGIEFEKSQGENGTDSITSLRRVRPCVSSKDSSRAPCSGVSPVTYSSSSPHRDPPT